MSINLDVDYTKIIRKYNKPKTDIHKYDLEVFLLDFFPYDESRLSHNNVSSNEEEDDEEEEEEDDKNYEDEDENESSGYGGDGSDDDQPYKSNKKTNKNNKDENKDENKSKNKFRVRIFGIIKHDNKYYSTSIDFLDFEPSFYIKIPDNWNKSELDNLIEKLKNEARKDPNAKYMYDKTLIKWEIQKAKPFYGYTANDKFLYAKLVFENTGGFNNFRNLLEYLGKNSYMWKQYQLYESNIEPMLRLLHIQDITPSGWIKIPKNKLKITESDTSDCQLHYEISYNNVIADSNNMNVPPLEIAAFDIESDSSHGDFPIAKKNNQKLGQDIMTEFLKQPQNNPLHLRALIHSWLTLAFNPYFDANNINKIITKGDIRPEEEKVEYIMTIVKKYGEQFHQSVQSIIAEGFDPSQVKGYQEYYYTQVQIELETHLPEIDYERSTTGNYKLLAEQLIKEVHRMIRAHNQQYLAEPENCIKFWIKLAFHPYYDNHNISHVYTHRHDRPNPEILANIVPQVYAICKECHDHLNKPKEKKKAVARIGPKKFWSLPPKKGETKLSDKINKNSDTFKSKHKFDDSSNDEDGDKKEKLKSLKSKKNEKVEERVMGKEKPLTTTKKFEKYKQPDEAEFTRGRYMKKRPEIGEDGKIPRIGRDFYVTWLHELFDKLFPHVEGDPVIQIGTTFKRYGESELFLKHIITLKGCDKFTNDQLIDDENKDIYITKPADAITEAEKLKLDTPLISIIKSKLDKATKDGNKKPDIPELDNLNELIYIGRKNKQLANDKSILRIECYDSEDKVLLAWRKLIKETDPDMVIGYNIFGFDLKYMWERAEVLNVIEEFRDISRIKRYPERLLEKKLQSSGLGDNLLHYFPMTGRILVDLLKVVQSGGYRLPIYKLDFVCNFFMYKRKNDLPPQQIFILQKGSDEDRATIARYCLIDCILCNRLIDRLEIVTNNLGMSRVCKVPLSYLFLRGQGVKILSLVSDITRKEGYMIKAKDRDEVKGDDWYEGAIVLDPMKGIYFEASAVADFNSLYPSCMIASNLSHDSFIELGGKYDNLPKDEYLDVLYDLYREETLPGRKKKIKVKVGIKTCRFYQPTDGSKSMLPRILQKLLKARKDTREEQEAYTKGSFEWNVKEGLQLAYKVTANSLYGQVGANTSAISFKEIAACTTACGRGLIYYSKDFFEKNYAGCSVIYGDSVTGDTPILVKDTDNMIDIITIEMLHQDAWQPYINYKPKEKGLTNKEQSVTSYTVWTDEGWSEINKVIRHKTNKKMYRVNSYQGCVDVTEDHSLIDINGDIIKPGNCEPIYYTEDENQTEINNIEDATSLLYSFPTEFEVFTSFVNEVGEIKENKNEGLCFECTKCKEIRKSDEFYYRDGKRCKQCKLCIKEKQAETKGKEFNGKLDRKILNMHVEEYVLTAEEAWVWGLFMAEGSCGKYGEKQSLKYSWAINNQDLDVLNKAKDILNSVEPELIKFKILDTMESSAVYKLVPSGSLKYMVEKYRPLFYDKDSYKIVPKTILNGPFEIRKQYFEGYYIGDGAKSHGYGLEINRISITCKGKIGSMCLYYLARSLGYNNLVINTRADKPNIYIIYTNESLEIENRSKIRRITKLKNSEDYVYDLETKKSKFHAGVGSLIIHNTDSIFTKFDTKNYRGEKLYGLDSIYKSIELCTEGALAISKKLPKPHNLDFEKAIWPFMLVSKKRYHGHYYSDYGKPKFKANSMGIVLKRRDNAKIVKHIFGGVLDIIMEEHDIPKAKKFCQEESKKLLEGKFPLDMFTITKTLKSYYKNPDQIAHNVLAQRIAERDPGNKVQSNDRMEFAYIKVIPKNGEKVLQGNRIETPEYIKEKKLELDYRFYLTNQVMKPVTQIFELVMNEKELCELFMESLMEYDRRMSGIQRITKFVSRNDDFEGVPAYGIIEKLLKEIHNEADKENNDKNPDFVAEQGDEVLIV